jgi:hypothetical protein
VSDETDSFERVVVAFDWAIATPDIAAKGGAIGRRTDMPLDDANWPTIEVDETTEILIRARGFLERGWCQNTLARDADGNAIKPISGVQ